MPNSDSTFTKHLFEVLALLGLLVSGCFRVGHGDEQPGDPDGGSDTEIPFDTDSDESDTADTDGDDDDDDSDDHPDYACPVDVSLACPEDRYFPGEYDSMLSPGNLQGHTLVNASPCQDVVLGHAPDGSSPRLVIVQYDGTGHSLLSIAPSTDGSNELEPVDVVTLPQQECRDNEMDYPRAVLGCAAVALFCDSHACHLYCLRTDEDGIVGDLSPMDGGRVPLEHPVAMTGIRRFPDVGESFDRVYVAGDGVAAFDGQTWQEHVAPGQAMFADIASGEEDGETSYVVAAGAGGALYTDLGGAWHPIDAGVDYDFTRTAALDNRWGTSGGALVASGKAGFILFAEGAIWTCPSPDLPVSHVLVRADYTRSHTAGVAVTAYTGLGQVIEAWPAESGNVLNCCLNDSGFMGAALFAGPSFTGADAYFSFLATTDDIYLRTELGIGP